MHKKESCIFSNEPSHHHPVPVRRKRVFFVLTLGTGYIPREIPTGTASSVNRILNITYFPYLLPVAFTNIVLYHKED